MRFDRDVPRRCAVVALSFACAALLAECGSSTPVPPATPIRAPSSCSYIPVSFIRQYMGPIASTKSLTAAPNALRCQFANSGTSKTLILTIQPGDASAFATLQTTSSAGGRTITSVSRLGSSAFSITKNRRPAGMAVLSARGFMISVSANLPLTKDKLLLTELLTEY